MKKLLLVLDNKLNIVGKAEEELDRNKRKKTFYESQLRLFKANYIVRDKKGFCVGLYLFNSDGDYDVNTPIVVGKSDVFMPSGIVETLEAAGKIVIEDIFLARELWIVCDEGEAIPPEYYELVAEHYAKRYPMKEQ